MKEMKNLKIENQFWGTLRCSTLTFKWIVIQNILHIDKKRDTNLQQRQQQCSHRSWTLNVGLHWWQHHHRAGCCVRACTAQRAQLSQFGGDLVSCVLTTLPHSPLSCCPAGHLQIYLKAHRPRCSPPSSSSPPSYPPSSAAAASRTTWTQPSPRSTTSTRPSMQLRWPSRTRG